MHKPGKNLCAILTAILFAVGAQSAFAALIDNGDTTFDTDTGLEWLDLTETAGMSYNEVLASSYVVNDGYRFATEAEVLELYGNSGGTGTQSTAFLTENKPAAILLLDLMGCTSVIYFAPSGCDGTPEEWSPAMWGDSSQYLALIDNYDETTGVLATRWSTHGNDDVSNRSDVAAFLVRIGSPPAPVPTLSSIGMLVVILLSLLMAARHLRAREQF